jgi:hypothetical protein
MSQISPPIRILLIGFLALVAAWMLFLRPKADTVEPTPAATATSTPVEAGGATAQSAVGQAVEKANEAAAAASGTAAAGEAQSAAAKTAAAPAAKAGESSDAKTKAGDGEGGLPKRVASAIADHKVVVLLFWSDKAADDRAVRRELAEVKRHDGKVLVHAAPMKRFGRYQQITRGATVAQSPTVVVVDRKRKAETVVGYADSVSIDQLVADALRTS